MQISLLTQQIIDEIEKHGGTVEGTEYLAITLNTQNRTHMLQCVRRLARDGEIHIIVGGGRGHKTVYKRNRNSPGAPRRRRTR